MAPLNGSGRGLSARSPSKRGTHPSLSPSSGRGTSCYCLTVPATSPHTNTHTPKMHPSFSTTSRPGLVTFNHRCFWFWPIPVLFYLLLPVCTSPQSPPPILPCDLPQVSTNTKSKSFPELLLSFSFPFYRLALFDKVNQLIWCGLIETREKGSLIHGLAK